MCAIINMHSTILFLLKRFCKIEFWYVCKYLCMCMCEIDWYIKVIIIQITASWKEKNRNLQFPSQTDQGSPNKGLAARKGNGVAGPSGNIRKEKAGPLFQVYCPAITKTGDPSLQCLKLQCNTVMAIMGRKMWVYIYPVYIWCVYIYILYIYMVCIW